MEDIEFPENLDVHVTYQVEKEIEGEVEEKPTPTVESTTSAEPLPKETLQDEEPEQNVPADEPIEESNQLDDTQNEDIQNEDTESQPDGEQVAKISNGEYDRIETVYVTAH